MGGEGEGNQRPQKSYFDVLGLCCSSEIPLVENVLKQIEGVKDVSVIVASRTVIVVHDAHLVSPTQIVNALNQARLEASVKACGETHHPKKWPSPYTLASGLLLTLSFLKYVCHPFRWLALGAVAAGIFPIAWKGLAALRNYRIDINILVLVAVIGTIAMEDYLEAGTIVFLFSSAEWLESRASHKATAAMSSLMSVAPQKAIIADTGEEVGVDEIKLNTVLAVKAGEVIPLDGIVVDGKCEVDEKTLTGESFPVAKHVGSTVLAGTINVNGYIGIKTTAVAEDCVVARMAKLVEEAQNKRSRTQRFIDKCASIYTPAILVLSIGIAVIPAALHARNPHHWFDLALVVLVSACPCALVLSTPVATFCALSNAAKSGLLIKGGDYLEILAKIKNLAFDKTGTVTRGEFSVEEFQSLDENVSTETLLYWVSSIESKSSHPMAAPLVGYAKFLSIEPKPEQVEDFQNFPGEGIHGRIDGRDIFIGNRRIASRAGCEIGVKDSTGDGRTVGYIFSGSTEVGIFSLSDTCRTGAEEAIRKLKSLGLRTAMLTGDSQAAAMNAQNQLHHALDEVRAELLPEDKARFIIELKKIGPTAMVGDGVNDAPALVSADIGISMGVSGSALATETSHVILMTNDVRKIPKAISLARKALAKVVQNVVLSIVTKVAILALAIAGHPYVWAAVLTDVGTCLLVILNSMLLLREGDHRSRKCCKSSTAPSLAGACSGHDADVAEDTHKCRSVDKGSKTCAGGHCLTKPNSNNQKPSLGLHSHHGHERKHHGCRSQDKLASCGHSHTSKGISCQNTSSGEEKREAHTAHRHSCTQPQKASDVHNHGCPKPGTPHHEHPHKDVHCDHGTHEARPHESPGIQEDHPSHCGEGHVSKGEAEGSVCGGHHRHTQGNEESQDRDGSNKWAIDVEWGDELVKHQASSTACMKREAGGCCRSYMKECCRRDGHIHHLGSGCSLSEITITTE
ncbi:hypothetical protein MLD38_014535 [Melastoma candidum]|uniref:Uncharacterized protein n=1 Tax=Melastoma candidum TaxID=119954 RepID=A0ACB9RGT6_9MYRT|nr:hypothetical protein MLD38_014535 [Melastoma candidum]